MKSWKKDKAHSYREARASDRGSADAYYWRSGNPHIWLDDIGKDVVTFCDMTEGEIAKYWEGYDNEPYRKEWD